MSTLSSSPLSQSTTFSQSSTVSPLKRKAMSVTQTYYLAHTARGKLSSEAARSDHNLRLLVGHANLLDSLMVELAEAEQEQESWFNQSVRKASKPESTGHIQWADTVVEDPEEDWEVEDAEDSDSEYDSDEDIEMVGQMATLQRISSQHYMPAVEEVSEEYDEEEDYAALSLHRTNSHSATSPPELDSDSEDSSEDESMPPSPPTTTLPSFTTLKSQPSKPAQQDQDQDSASEQQAFFDTGFFRTPGLVTAISVY